MSDDVRATSNNRGQQTQPASPPAHSVLFALRGTVNTIERAGGFQINPSFRLAGSELFTFTYTPEANAMFWYSSQAPSPLSATALRGVPGVRYNSFEGTLSADRGDEVHRRSSFVQLVNYFNVMVTPSRHSPFQIGVRLALGFERLSDDTIRTVEDRPPMRTCPPGDIFCRSNTTTTSTLATRQVMTDSSRTTAFLRAGVRVNVTLFKPLRLGLEALGQGNVTIAGSSSDSFSFFVRAPLTLTLPMDDTLRFVAEIRSILNFARNEAQRFELLPAADARIGVLWMFDL